MLLYSVKDKPIITADWQVYVVVAVVLIGIISIVICLHKTKND